MKMTSIAMMMEMEIMDEVIEMTLMAGLKKILVMMVKMKSYIS